MPPIDTSAEEAVIEFLARRAPCTVDEVLASLTTHDRSEIFSAIGAALRDARLSLQDNPSSGYQLLLPSSSSLSRSVHTASTPVPFCMGCGYLCDTINPEDPQAPWIDAHLYLQRYGGTWAELDRHEELCPTCARISSCARQRGDTCPPQAV